MTSEKECNHKPPVCIACLMEENSKLKNQVLYTYREVIRQLKKQMYKGQFLEVPDGESVIWYVGYGKCGHDGVLNKIYFAHKNNMRNNDNDVHYRQSCGRTEDTNFMIGVIRVGRKALNILGEEYKKENDTLRKALEVKE